MKTPVKRNLISISSQEPAELEDLERLAKDIFCESEEEGYQFHGFYEYETVRGVFGDSVDESEPFEGFSVDARFKMLDNFENNRVKDRPTIFDKVIPKDYAKGHIISLI